MKATELLHKQHRDIEERLEQLKSAAPGGDRAVRESLDAFAFAVSTNGSRDARHQLAHVEFVHDDDLPRLRTLGVISNVTPL